MRLAAPETVITILGIQNSPGALTVAGAALDATFNDLEARIDSFLQRTTRTDYFDLSSSEVSHPRLRLTSGFVSQYDDFVIRYSADGLPLSSATGTTLDSGWVADFVAGVVSVDGAVPSGVRVLSVSYVHGFDLSDDGLTFEDVPLALQQAHISLACEYMMLNPANIAKEKARFTAEVAVHGFGLKASRAVRNLQRPRGTVVWPSHTEATCG